jgi:NADPH-dependent glutamate synthase beta subunit-like oxidoreductase
MDKSFRPGKREEDIVPCTEACPAHIDVPEYVRLIADGKREEAHAVIREKVPFPGILGRVCTHPCEEACRRGEVNEPVSICALKRYASDRDEGLWKKNMKAGDETGKKVAVVGAGPAGLSAAFYLRKMGHSVTVFEGRKKAGGMMRYGIPAYRLPRDNLDKEIADILDLGIEMKTEQALGRDFSLDQLKNDWFEAVFLGVGAQQSRRIGLDGSDLPDLLWGVDFLGQVAEGDDIRLRERVIVIGGGSVAIDAALTALRCGAKEVVMACLENREEMPAHAWEVEEAIKEGVKIMPSRGPHRILSKDGMITGIELVRSISLFDDQSACNPSFDDTKETIEGDQVIFAIGQDSDLSFLDGDSPIDVEKGLIVVDQESLETGQKGVYAGGDVTALPGTIIHAIAAGRKAASAIDLALGGDGEIEEILFERKAPSQYMGRDEGFATWPREKVPELELESRAEGFQEVVLGYTDEQALREAKRCLQCDLRLYMGSNPSPRGTTAAFDEERVRDVPQTEGVYRLYDEEHHVLAIQGTANLRESLLEALEENKRATGFDFEEDKMYSRRESELIRAYLQEYGQMPGGGDDDLEDLF